MSDVKESKHETLFRELGWDITKWKLVGGTDSVGINSWHLNFGDRPIPPLTNNCICGQNNLVDNHYIQHIETKEIKIIGSSCVNKFIPKENRMRKCNICGNSHKNIKRNRCNDCKYIYCDKCNISISYNKDKICHTCENDQILINNILKTNCYESVQYIIDISEGLVLDTEQRSILKKFYVVYMNRDIQKIIDSIIRDIPDFDIENNTSICDIINISKKVILNYVQQSELNAFYNNYMNRDIQDIINNITRDVEELYSHKYNSINYIIACSKTSILNDAQKNTLREFYQNHMQIKDEELIANIQRDLEISDKIQILINCSQENKLTHEQRAELKRRYAKTMNRDVNKIIKKLKETNFNCDNVKKIINRSKLFPLSTIDKDILIKTDQNYNLCKNYLSEKNRSSFNIFEKSLYDQFKKNGYLTEKQIDALRKNIENKKNNANPFKDNSKRVISIYFESYIK